MLGRAGNLCGAGHVLAVFSDRVPIFLRFCSIKICLRAAVALAVSVANQTGFGRNEVCIESLAQIWQAEIRIFHIFFFAGNHADHWSGQLPDDIADEWPK
jgi:hypothetical protein